MNGLMEVLGTLAGVVAVAALGSWFAAGGVNALAGLVSGWREPGWPQGVQEEDEVRWGWRSSVPTDAGLARPTTRRVDPGVAWRGR